MLVCPEHLINCVKCDELIIRKNVAIHFEHECPEEIVKCTKYELQLKRRLKKNQKR